MKDGLLLGMSDQNIEVKMEEVISVTSIFHQQMKDFDSSVAVYEKMLEKAGCKNGVDGTVQEIDEKFNNMEQTKEKLLRFFGDIHRKKFIRSEFQRRKTRWDKVHQILRSLSSKSYSTDTNESSRNETGHQTDQEGHNIEEDVISMIASTGSDDTRPSVKERNIVMDSGRLGHASSNTIHRNHLKQTANENNNATLKWSDDALNVEVCQEFHGSSLGDMSQHTNSSENGVIAFQQLNVNSDIQNDQKRPCVALQNNRSYEQLNMSLKEENVSEYSSSFPEDVNSSDKPNNRQTIIQTEGTLNNCDVQNDQMHSCGAEQNERTSELPNISLHEKSHTEYFNGVSADLTFSDTSDSKQTKDNKGTYNDKCDPQNHQIHACDAPQNDRTSEQPSKSTYEESHTEYSIGVSADLTSSDKPDSKQTKENKGTHNDNCDIQNDQMYSCGAPQHDMTSELPNMSLREENSSEFSSDLSQSVTNSDKPVSRHTTGSILEGQNGFPCNSSALNQIEGIHNTENVHQAPCSFQCNENTLYRPENNDRTGYEDEQVTGLPNGNTIFGQIPDKLVDMGSDHQCITAINMLHPRRVHDDTGHTEMYRKSATRKTAGDVASVNQSVQQRTCWKENTASLLRYLFKFIFFTCVIAIVFLYCLIVGFIILQQNLSFRYADGPPPI